MKRLAHHLARLYPQQWRVRYGREFDALLEDTDLAWSDLLDVIAGAFRVRIETAKARQLAEGENEAMERPATLVRILDLKDRDIPRGYELETTIEHSREDGTKTIVRQFFRELDFGGSYLTVSHMARDSEAAQTLIVSGTKGEVAGDFRTDRIELIALHSDGTVRRSEQTVKTWLKHEAIREALRAAYRRGQGAGLSPDQIYQELRLKHGSEAEAREHGSRP